MKPGPIKGSKRGEKRYDDGLTASQRHYRRNKEKILQRARDQRSGLLVPYRGPGETRKALYVRRMKEKTPCTDCKRFYPACVMDFDHVRGKKLFNIGLMMAQSMETIKEEIAKCELVCSNCHRIRTKVRGSKRRYEKTLEYFDGIAGNSAEDTGGEPPGTFAAED